MLIGLFYCISFFIAEVDSDKDSDIGMGIGYDTDFKGSARLLLIYDKTTFLCDMV